MTRHIWITSEGARAPEKRSVWSTNTLIRRDLHRELVTNYPYPPISVEGTGNQPYYYIRCDREFPTKTLYPGQKVSL